MGGREDHGHAGRGDGAVDEVHRTGGGARGAGPGVGLDDRPVLGDEAQDAGAQRGHGQAQLQARAADQRRVDGTDAVTCAVAEGGGQRLEVEDRAAAGAEVAAHRATGTRHRRPGAACGAGACGGPGAPGAAHGAPSGRRHRLAVGQGASRAEGERWSGALGDLGVDLAAERGPLERTQTSACFPKTCSVCVQVSTSPSISSTRCANSDCVRACASTVAAMAPADVAVMMSA